MFNKLTEKYWLIAEKVDATPVVEQPGAPPRFSSPIPAKDSSVTSLLARNRSDSACTNKQPNTSQGSRQQHPKGEP
eukprot:5141642-Amphidinium_carterae.2